MIEITYQDIKKKQAETDQEILVSSNTDEKQAATVYQEAMDQALRFLAPRFLSRAELTRKLRQKSYDDDTIERVISRLEELDYVDDARLSNDVLNWYMREGKHSVSYIRNKMYQRGLTVGPALKDYDEMLVALRLVWRKFRGNTPVDDSLYYEPWDEETRVPAKKIVNFLKNRGFTLSVIQYVVSLNGEGSPYA